MGALVSVGIDAMVDAVVVEQHPLDEAVVLLREDLLRQVSLLLVHPKLILHHRH